MLAWLNAVALAALYTLLLVGIPTATWFLGWHDPNPFPPIATLPSIAAFFLSLWYLLPRFNALRRLRRVAREGQPPEFGWYVGSVLWGSRGEGPAGLFVGGHIAFGTCLLMVAMVSLWFAVTGRVVLLSVVGVLGLVVAILVLRMPRMAGPEERLLLTALRRYAASGNRDGSAFDEAVGALRSLVTWPQLHVAESVEQAHPAERREVD